ncbi:unnamed protein product [Cylicocyclus nassatus]|uniref:Uncharacterized protein n=1 Tax=Cylicocyclus nassatus TaxID=53992 RepID=A0AA36MCZ9_CYLNA|nr:unnamed protein product [Cylicocyclus nassatus]
MDKVQIFDVTFEVAPPAKGRFQRFLVLAHLLFLALSIWLMWNVGAVEVAGLPVPGLDGLLPFDVLAREALRGGDNDSL